MLNKNLKSEIHSDNPNSLVIVLFGGNPQRRHQILSLLEAIGGIHGYGTLSEQEGLDQLAALPRVDLVIIGSRYTPEQRIRIRHYIEEHTPTTKITEPGIDYAYSDEHIIAAIKQLLVKDQGSHV